MMNIRVFGQLEDITGSSMVSIEKVPDTDRMLSELYGQYPLLKEKKFLIAVDQKIISEKTAIFILKPYR